MVSVQINEQLICYNLSIQNTTWISAKKPKGKYDSKYIKISKTITSTVKVKSIGKTPNV